MSSKDFQKICRFCQNNMIGLITGFLLSVVVISMVLPMVLLEFEPNESLVEMEGNSNLAQWRASRRLGGAEPAAPATARTPPLQPPAQLGGQLPGGAQGATAKPLCECSYLEHTDIKGGDLYSIQTPSKEECCDGCQKEKQCSGWTLDGGICYLKDIQALTQYGSLPANMKWGLWSGKSCKNQLATQQQAPAVTNEAQSVDSGIWKAFVADDDCVCQLEMNVDFFGGDIRALPLESPEECCAACNQDPVCFSFTYADTMCYFKKAGVKSQYKQNLVSGHSCKPTPEPTPAPPPPDREHAQTSVKLALKHAWDGYADTCFGQDELKPISRACGNWLGAGLTIIDSMSTLWIMNLTEDFTRAKDWIAKELRFDFSKDISFFETVIRILGGLLSAYDLTGEKVFVDKAEQLAESLMPAFHPKTGMTYGKINLQTGSAKNPSWSHASVLAEVGTIQMEYFALSRHTGIPKWRRLAQRIVDHLEEIKETSSIVGLYPLFINTDSGRFKNQKFSFGGCGDSFYEYLLKVWLLTGKKNTQFRDMYVESINAMIDHMLETSSEGFMYLPSIDRAVKKREMEHLTCFAAGMLALGAASGATDQATGKKHMQVAEELARTCYESYNRQASGIGPESSRFEPSFHARDAAYHMRPETVESLFYLWRITKDQKYRDWGWQIFVSIERWCKRDVGYSGIKDVRIGQGAPLLDKQESFFLAETMKYLYLLFSDDSVLPLMGLDDGKPGFENSKFWVLNTEAHPILAWDASEDTVK